MSFCADTNVYTSVARTAPTKIQVSQYRHTMYLRQTLVKDSAFPFSPGEPLETTIDGEYVILHRAADLELPAQGTFRICQGCALHGTTLGKCPTCGSSPEERNRARRTPLRVQANA